MAARGRPLQYSNKKIKSVLGWKPHYSLEEGLDRSLADPLLFTKDPAKGSAVSKKRAEAARKLAAIESQWVAAQEEYETAMAAD